MGERLRTGGEQPHLSHDELKSLSRLRATIIDSGENNLVRRPVIGPEDPLYNLKQELQQVLGAENAVKEAMIIMQDARSGDNTISRHFSSWGQENVDLMEKLKKIGKGFITGAAAGAAILIAVSLIGPSVSGQAVISFDMFFGIVGACLVYENYENTSG